MDIPLNSWPVYNQASGILVG